MTFFFVGPCERGDDYSEAKIITELRALALSSVASQTHHLFPVADKHLVSFPPTDYSSCSQPTAQAHVFQPAASYKIITSHRRTK